MSEINFGLEEVFHNRRQKEGLSAEFTLHANLWVIQDGLMVAWRPPRIDRVWREKILRNQVFFPALREVSKENGLDIRISEPAQLTENTDILSKQLQFDGLRQMISSVVEIGPQIRDYRNMGAIALDVNVDAIRVNRLPTMIGEPV